jgi:hypothetical protein
VLFAVLLALGVTEKHDAAHDTRGRHPENGLGLHYSRFSPISADRLLFPQLLAGSKIGNPAANRPSQASGPSATYVFDRAPLVALLTVRVLADASEFSSGNRASGHGRVSVSPGFRSNVVSERNLTPASGTKKPARLK